MTHLRLRLYGAAEWSSLIIQGDLEETIMQVVGSALSTSTLHVQVLNEEDEWEDLE